MQQILIESLTTIIVDLPTIRPHKLAMHTMQKQTLVLVRLRCADGITGWGEATTIGGLSYGGESPESIKTNIDTLYRSACWSAWKRARGARPWPSVRKVIQGNRFAKCAHRDGAARCASARLNVPLSRTAGRPGARLRCPWPGRWPAATPRATSPKARRCWKCAATASSS